MQAAETASLDLASTQNTSYLARETKEKPAKILLMACANRSICYLFYHGEVQGDKRCESKQVL